MVVAKCTQAQSAASADTTRKKQHSQVVPIIVLRRQRGVYELMLLFFLHRWLITLVRRLPARRAPVLEESASASNHVE